MISRPASRILPELHTRRPTKGDEPVARVQARPPAEFVAFSEDRGRPRRHHELMVRRIRYLVAVRPRAGDAAVAGVRWLLTAFTRPFGQHSTHITDKENAAMFDLPELLIEYDRARAYTDALWRDLSSEEVNWRPTPNSSAIGWHLGHQAHVAHFMLRNLTAAEPSPDPGLDSLMDSATPEPDRGDLPSLDQLAAFRAVVAARIHARMTAVDAHDIGAPAQQRTVGRHVLTLLINHEYQHDQWISEVHERDLGRGLPPGPAGTRLTLVDNYLTLADPADERVENRLTRP